MTTFIILIVGLVLSLILLMRDLTEMFINTDNGYYIASPNGIVLPKMRIRMTFALDVTGKMPIQVLFSICKTAPNMLIYTLKLNKFNNALLLTRVTGANSNKKDYEIETKLTLNDGNWHSLDMSINIDTNIINVMVDGVELEQLTDSDKIQREMGTFFVTLGGFIGGISFCGKFKDIYFGDILKTDISYQTI